MELAFAMVKLPRNSLEQHIDTSVENPPHLTSYTSFSCPFIKGTVPSHGTKSEFLPSNITSTYHKEHLMRR